MASVPKHIPIHIRVHGRPGCPPEVTVEPACVHARTRDTLDWELQGGGRFALDLLDGQTPFGSVFRLTSDGDGCCSEMVGWSAEPSTYHYSLEGKAAIPVADGSGSEPSTAQADPPEGPTHFTIQGRPEIVIQ